MNFKNNIVSLGKGGLISCRVLNGKAAVLIKDGGEIRKTEFDLRTKSLKNGGALSLADECFLTETGRIEQTEEFYYVEN